MSRNSVVLIEGRFFLVLVTADDFQIIGSEFFNIHFLDAVNELNWSCVAVFGKKRYSHVTCLDGFKHVVHRFVDKQRILNFVLRLLGALSVQSLYYLRIVGFRRWEGFRLFFLLVAVGIARLKETGNF